ncbi:MAG: hypothetical protein ACHQNA_06235 [Acidimicrobiales bacterium]
MSTVVPLARAHDEAIFGAKAVGLGEAMRAGLPVPPGLALAGAIVEEVAAGHEDAIREVVKAAESWGGPQGGRGAAGREPACHDGR